MPTLNEQLLEAAKKGDNQAISTLLGQGAEINCQDSKGHTPLLLAMQGEFESTTQLLLKQGAHIDIKDGYDNTPLHYAVFYEWEELAKALVEKGSSIGAVNEQIGRYYYGQQRSQQNSVSPLSIAFHNKCEPLIAFFLEKLSDINLKDVHGRSPLHLAIQHDLSLELIKLLINKGIMLNEKDSKYYKKTSLEQAIDKKAVPLIKLLLASGALGDEKYITEGNAIHLVIKQNFTSIETAQILNQLLEQGVSLETTDKEGLTALGLACKCRNLVAVEILLDKGAKVNVLDNHQNTVLHLLFTEINRYKGGTIAEKDLILAKSIIETFLLNKVDINATNAAGFTPLDIAISNLPDATGEQLIQFMINKGAFCAKPNFYCYQKNTLLHFATERNWPLVTAYLLKSKAEVNAKNEEGHTALHIAFKKGFQPIIEQLLEAGTDLSLRDNRGNTILHLAVEQALIDINRNSSYGSLGTKEKADRLALIRLLLKNDININARNNAHQRVLDIAISSGSEELAGLLLEHGADITVDAEAKESLLHIAIKKGLQNCIKLLLHKGAQIEVKNNEGYSCLEFAIEEHYYYPNIIALLLEHTLCVNSITNEGDTPLHLAIKAALKWIELNEKYPSLKTTSNTDYEAVSRMLLEKGADCTFKNSQGQTPFDLAIAADRKPLIKLLLEHASNLDYVNTDGNTLLHLAILYRFNDVAERLIEKAINIHAKNNHGQTALDLAIEQNQPDVILILLAKGATFETKDESGDTLLHVAARRRWLKVVNHLLAQKVEVTLKNKAGLTPLDIMVTDTRGENIAIALLHHGAQFTIKEETGNTPLHIAAKNRWDKVITLLIEKGAILEAKNQEGATALDIAIEKSDESSVNVLLEKGAIWKVQEDTGNTLLHIATQNRWEDTVKLLINKGVALEAKNKAGFTAFDLALQLWRAESITLLLLTKGARFDTVDDAGNTALHRAIQNGWSKVVDYLLEQKVDLEIKNQDGLTPLGLAIRCKREHYVHGLLKQGAKHASDPDTGDTILHIAVGHQWLSVLSLALEQFGELVELTNKAGYTSYELAVKTNDLSMVNGFFDYKIKQSIKAGLEQHHQLITTQSDTIKQLTKDVEQLKQEINAVKEINQKLNQEHALQQTQLKSTLKLSEAILKPYQQEEQKIIKAQAMVKGFFARKKNNLSVKQAQRKQAIEAQLPQIFTDLIKEGKYVEVKQLSEAMEHQRWHEADRMIKKIPEKEMTWEGKIIRY